MADNVAPFACRHLIQTDMAATKNDGARGGSVARGMAHLFDDGKALKQRPIPISWTANSRSLSILAQAAGGWPKSLPPVYTGPTQPLWGNQRVSDHLAEDFTSRYGPWALIAGASEGLGAAFAECLAKQGIHLLLVARRREPLETLAGELRAEFGVEVVTTSLDVADETALTGFIAAIDVELGLVICNAAYSAVGAFLETPPEQLKQIVGVNVIAPLVMVRLLAPQMKSRGKGGVILMSSLAGNQGSANIATYAASKSFNTVLAEGLWLELKRAGIDVVAPCAGAIRTPGYQRAQSGPEAPGTMGATDVAYEALAALGRGPVVVPGRFNRFALFLMRRLLPRKKAIEIMSSSTKGLTS